MRLPYMTLPDRQYGSETVRGGIYVRLIDLLCWIDENPDEDVAKELREAFEAELTAEP